MIVAPREFEIDLLRMVMLYGLMLHLFYMLEPNCGKKLNSILSYKILYKTNLVLLNNSTVSGKNWSHGKMILFACFEGSEAYTTM